MPNYRKGKRKNKNKNRTNNNNKIKANQPAKDNVQQKDDEVQVSAATSISDNYPLTPPSETSDDVDWKSEYPLTPPSETSDDVDFKAVELSIQEISDFSSMEDSDSNQPIVCESDSEGSSGQNSPQKQSIVITEAETLELSEALSESSADDQKAKKAQRRKELESHFLPQLLNPRYLDSIQEEGSDLSDCERGKQNVPNPQHPAIPRKRLPSRDTEETFPIIVEAKLVDSPEVAGKCSLLAMNVAPESEAAEMVYIDSASSSASDLMDLTSSFSSDASAESDVRQVNAKLLATSFVGDLGVESIRESFAASSSPSSAVNGDNSASDKLFYVSCESEDENESKSLSKNTNCSSVEISIPMRDSKEQELSSPSGLDSMQPDESMSTSTITSNCSKSNKTELIRAKSFESNCSEESYSTTHSQCTAINTASFSDFSAFANMPDESANSANAVKNLRSICVDRLSSMPYGNLVLENLASTAENLQSLLETDESKTRQLIAANVKAEEPDAENNRLLEILRGSKESQAAPAENASKLNKFVNTQPFTPDLPLPPPPPPPIQTKFNEPPAVPPPPSQPSEAIPSSRQTHFLQTSATQLTNGFIPQNNTEVPLPPPKTHQSSQAVNLHSKQPHSEQSPVQPKHSETVEMLAPSANCSTFSSYESSSSSNYKEIKNDQVVVDKTSSKRESFKDHNGHTERSSEMHEENNLDKMMSDVKINNRESGSGDKTPTSKIGGLSAKTTSTESRDDFKEFINRSKAAAEEQRRAFFSSNSTYDEFRQRAKEMSEKKTATTTGTPAKTAETPASSAIFNYDDIFKDFDALSNLLKEEAERPKSLFARSSNFSTLNKTCARSEMNLFSKYEDVLNKPIQFKPKSELNISTKAEKEYEESTLKRNSMFDEHTVPIQIENEFSSSARHRQQRAQSHIEEPVTRRVPIHFESRLASPPPPPPPPPQRVSMGRELRSPFDGAARLCRDNAQKYQSCQNFEEWTRFLDDPEFKGSSENITRPFKKEVGICLQGTRPRGIRAPRLTASTTDLSNEQKNFYGSFPRWNFVANAGGRMPVPQTYMDKVHSSQESVLHQKSYKQAQQKPEVIPEDGSVSQQMAEEWLNQVAEREARRLQKIIKISKMKNDPYERRSAFGPDIGEEFLKRVKERRRKLCIQSDSELESGTDVEYSSSGKKSETDEPVKIIEGQEEASMRKLPSHMKEFVKFTKEVKFQESVEKKCIKTSEISKEEESEQANMFTPKFKAKPPPGYAGVWSPHTSAPNLYQPEVIVERPIPLRPPPMTTHPIEEVSHEGANEYRYNQSEEHIHQPWTSATAWNSLQADKSPSCGELNTCRRIPPQPFGSGSNISNKIQKFEKSSSFTDLKHPIRNAQRAAGGGGFVKPNEVIYSLKNEYMSEPECESDAPKKMAQLGRRKFDGIGPTTNDGMPIVLRSEVNQPNQHDWYKRIFQTLHKPKFGGRYPYKSSGYLSEPDTHYDSDYYTMNDTLDRRRATAHTDPQERYYNSNVVKSSFSCYKNQPGRIEDYLPGKSSSLAEREKHEQLKKSKLSPIYTEGHLSRSLREQGYESDSHVVFRKKEDTNNYISKPTNQKEAYKAVQAGAEPPLLGFRKPAPEKPKDDCVEHFDVIPITSTLHKIKIFDCHSLGHFEQESKILLSETNPFRSHVEMSSAKDSPRNETAPKRPPAPPMRSAGRSNVHECRKNLRARHETCLQPNSVCNKYGTITLRKRDVPIIRSKSTGSANKPFFTFVKDKPEAVEGVWRQRTVRVSSVSPIRANSRLNCLRKTSPVAFGRSISKERTFAEEKKRIEESQLINRRSFCASTNILRDPNLKSPDEVKKAVRNYALPLRRSKSSPRPALPAFHDNLVPPHQIYSKITTYQENKSKPSTVKPASTSITKMSTSKNGMSRCSFSLDKKSRLKNSTLSIAQTNSTFSIDSCGSKGKTVAKKSLHISKTQNGTSPAKSTTFVATETEETMQPAQSIQEKAKLWNSLSNGFSSHESRSLSPHFRRRPEYRFFEEVSKYQHLSKLSDDESEFSDHQVDFEWNYEPRSLSETRATPVRKFSPTREVRVPPQTEIRSPSRRRIQSCKKGNEAKNVARASSLSSADKKDTGPLSPMHKCDHLSHSASSLNYLEGHSRNCEFRKSQRFIDLNRFYNTLERVAQLELATSATNLKPIRKEDEITDYSEWKKLRTHERAEKELNYLVSQLKMEEKQNDFLFRPKDVQDVKWREASDFGLRSKEKSVEDVRDAFENKIKGTSDEKQRGHHQFHRDDYKTLWRGNSVANLAASLENKYNTIDTVGRKCCSRGAVAADKDVCLSNHLMSTLSRDQVTQIRKQLNEIYTPAEQKTDKYVITVKKDQPRSDKSLTVRSNSSITKKDLLGSTLEKKQQKAKESKWRSMPEMQPGTKGTETVTKHVTKVHINGGKALSETIMREIREKALEFESRSKQSVCKGRETRGAIAAENAKKSLPEVPIPPPLPKTLPPPPVVTYVEPKDSLEYEYVDADNFEEIEVEVPDDAIQKKIQYFEEKRLEEPTKTIYHAREYSSPDEEEVLRIVAENRKMREESRTTQKSNLKRNDASLSASDLRDFFGERPARRANFCLPRPPPAPNEKAVAPFRSRSLSPAPPQSHVAHLHKVHTGDVKKICDLLEANAKLRRTSSDPELAKKTDVSWMAHHFEVHNNRGRSRIRKVVSPIPKTSLKKENILMPHIDIISKTAALKEEMCKTYKPASSSQPSPSTGKVRNIRCQFENIHNGMRRRSTSDPDIGNTTDISHFLKGIWIAHKFPKPNHNTLTPKSKSPRIRSASPTRAPKPSLSTAVHSADMFANQKYDPSIHRPKARYVPDASDSCAAHGPGDRDSKEIDEIESRTLTEKVDLIENGYNNRVSPSRYIETDVNIHYKTPVRYEYKEVISEDELAYRQAESMKKLYQEEKRQKYLRELQDINARRHTDNFTASQKSPIPLNRYDDFPADLAPKSPNFTNTICRALYNFQGQTVRELTFKKGDLIILRRLVDENWYEGEHKGQMGLLPVKYVEIITQESFMKKRPKTPSEGQARAKFNFQAQSGIELSLNKGELVALTRRVDKNWYEGKIANRKGIFPASYIEILTDIGADDKLIKSQTPQLSPEALRTSIYNDLNNLMKTCPTDSLRPTKTVPKTKALHVDTHSEPVHYRAIYKYRPQNNDELELQEGDIIHVLEICDDGWFVGTSQRSGCFGTFPGNYVERL